MKFRVAHAADVPPGQLGLWFVHEHSASFTMMAMTEARWLTDTMRQPAADVLQWQTGPRWGVIVDERTR
jgi:hypothetical protein